MDQLRNGIRFIHVCKERKKRYLIGSLNARVRIRRVLVASFICSFITKICLVSLKACYSVTILQFR